MGGARIDHLLYHLNDLSARPPEVTSSKGEEHEAGTFRTRPYHGFGPDGRSRARKRRQRRTGIGPADADHVTDGARFARWHVAGWWPQDGRRELGARHGGEGDRQAAHGRERLERRSTLLPGTGSQRRCRGGGLAADDRWKGRAQRLRGALDPRDVAHQANLV